MAWTAPRTWTTGELVTKSIMDTHVRDNLRFLGGQSTGIGTSLPGSPSDQEPFVLVDSLTAPTWLWHLRYFSALASHKWVCTGGMPMSNFTTPGTSLTSSSYSTFSGPTITLPIAGVYAVTLTVMGHSSAGSDGHVSYDVGGTAAADDWGTAIRTIASAGTHPGSGERVYWHTVAGSTALATKGRNFNGTTVVDNCRISAIPINLD